MGEDETRGGMLEEQYRDDNDNDNVQQRIVVAMPESRPFGWCFAG
jgi:hypothetical protein